jgi:hypothetical protein
MTTTAELLQLLIPAEALRDLTNYDGTGTSTDTTYLGNWATACEGAFGRWSGIAFDVDNSMHHGPIVAVAQYYLEMAKGRDRSGIEGAKRLAIAECKDLKGLISVSPQTSSPLTTDVPDVDDAYPDMSIQNFNSKPSSIINERGKSAKWDENSPSS